MVETNEKTRFVIAHLGEKINTLQWKLDIQFSTDEKISFFTVGGKAIVNLTGYSIDELENPFGDEQDSDDMEEEEVEDEGEEEESEEEEIGKLFFDIKVNKMF